MLFIDTIVRLVVNLIKTSRRFARKFNSLLYSNRADSFNGIKFYLEVL